MPSKKEVEDVVSRIVPVDEAEPYVKILVYGRHGSGKTRFAASAPNCLIVDINERGTRSARESGSEVLHVREWDDINLVYWHLKKNEHEYETVALDTLTALQALCMSHVLGVEADKDPNKDSAMPTRREWGKLTEVMRPTLLNFRNLDMHVVFTAQERLITDDDGDVIERVPDLSPGSRGPACGAVGIIGRLYRKEVRGVSKAKKKEVSVWEDRMLLGPHDQFPDLKDRSNALGRVLRKPTMSQVIDAWLKEE